MLRDGVQSATLPRVAVVVSTYNRPRALDRTLDSLLDQTYPDFEIIVADDGSTPETRVLVERMAARSPVPLLHVWQEDRGYRLAAIRNRAVASAASPYIVFLDEDCVVRPEHVRRHAKLSEKGFFVTGSRIRLGRRLTDEVLAGRLRPGRWSQRWWIRERLRGRVDRFGPVLSLPLGGLRKLQPNTWRGVKGCNFAVWKSDFDEVKGFDEAYRGWGYEDNDLALRLIRNGARKKTGRFAVPVFHLWHEQRPQDELSRSRFREQLRSNRHQALATRGDKDA